MMDICESCKYYDKAKHYCFFHGLHMLPDDVCEVYELAEDNE